MNALSITKVKVKTLFWAAALAPALLAGCSTSQPQREAALQQQNPDTYARQQQNAPLTVADVKAMSKAGIAEDTIVAKIRDSHTIFHLSANDVLDLHSSGVPQKVLDCMISTQSEISSAPPASAPVAPPPPPAAAQAPPPAPAPGYVWVNGEWVWNNGWYWSGGYWLWPPYPGAVWVGGYWHRGPSGWVRYGGRWRR
ncbi:MAG: hypothetical protein ACLQVY_29545 [Limisphaerales bacterium]